MPATCLPRGTSSYSFGDVAANGDSAHVPSPPYALSYSFGDVAASGGYYLACGADKIVAQPGTITGSIGVVVGKFNVRGLLEEWGGCLWGWGWMVPPE